MAPETQFGALVGSVLGGVYQVTRLIGEGGMGWVYEARQLRLNKRVAVKLMARELASNQEALARFHREAEVTSHLGHPHLVNVMDFGTTEAGEPYLVMEYLDGEDLDHRLRRVGHLPLEAAVAITTQVASALAAAHAEGIVHRDLKPANVFLVKVRDEADFVKVLDFGVSKIKAARTKLTRATAVIGTPEYMSPEQATGLIEEIDHHADQWALGCIAWEMVSGRAPFVADDMGALFYQVINMDPHPLARRVSDLPPGVEAVLRRALAKRIADRFPSIKEFAKAFEAAARGQPLELTPVPLTVARPSPAKGTVGYGGAVAAPQAAGGVAEEMVSTHRDVADDLADDLPVWRFKPIYLLPLAAVVVLVGALLLFWPGKSPPAATTTPAPAPRAPTVVTLPAPPPAPEPPAAPIQPTPTRGPKAKSAKAPTLDDLLKGATTEKPKAGGVKANPFADPFEGERARPKPTPPPPAGKPTRARPQGQLVEEL
jgi:eukaryotic-like serine/threonine-protein kinase